MNHFHLVPPKNSGSFPTHSPPLGTEAKEYRKNKKREERKEREGGRIFEEEKGRREFLIQNLEPFSRLKGNPPKPFKQFN